MTSSPEQSPDTLETRSSLLTRLRDWGDAPGWREFFDTYWQLIYSVARRSGMKDHDAQDLVQEVMVSVAREMPDFHYDPARGRFKAWLLRIVHRRVADHWRTGVARRQNTVSMEDEIVPEPIDDTGFEKLWQDEWQQQMLALALRRVKARVSVQQFMIFEMAEMRRLPMAEIRRGLGVSTTQVYLARHRVRKMVRHELRQLGES
ncbi:sigma-70 family RNA polymerase sigma factor [Prosthecobacter sp.]|uniref:RNA polymerase sigma factor n=1 Tax=Prosthecobacter sp. TaxID=1965333 RepID=UPI001D9A8B4D|nr:sigma-70 family RNA polymerase sigma factor [Prosthecobacter sp.]MCB1275324.1 sigma-70 family RNA polymerase sigma factor [Prosthecobacter sp.]